MQHPGPGPYFRPRCALAGSLALAVLVVTAGRPPPPFYPWCPGTQPFAGDVATSTYQVRT
ncbi:hypothetical protein U9M48_044185 [Paspalum notatum var. saurae]|uniref:Uncharacterized protein n=1 Tax=Paspalum notatum var. saurae TaxID=547442 RepID=A0AAQ3XH87_PASNO